MAPIAVGVAAMRRALASGAAASIAVARSSTPLAAYLPSLPPAATFTRSATSFGRSSVSPLSMRPDVPDSDQGAHRQEGRAKAHRHDACVPLPLRAEERDSAGHVCILQGGGVLKHHHLALVGRIVDVLREQGLLQPRPRARKHALDMMGISSFFCAFSSDVHC